MMDADVEMVDQSRRSCNGDGAAEDLNLRVMTDSSAPSYKCWIAVAAMGFMFYVAMVLHKTTDIPFESVFASGNENDVKELDENDKIVVNQVFEGFHKHQNNVKNWMNKHSNGTAASGGDDHPGPLSKLDGGGDKAAPLTEPPTPTTLTQNVEDWLAATVTKADGVMYEIVEQLVHDKTSFIEGLTFYNGELFESAGRTGRSAVLRVDPKTGTVLQRVEMESKYFAEGLVYLPNPSGNDKLLQLTYKKKTGFIYNAADLTEPPTTFKYETKTGEGWGFTYNPDAHELVVSDGSEYLIFWDPDTLQELRRVPTTMLDGRKGHWINELEYWRGRIIANIWQEDTIIVIDPTTGKVEKEYDFSSLWPARERYRMGAEVLNGISISDDPDVLYVTGKNWDRMFLIRLLA